MGRTLVRFFSSTSCGDADGGVGMAEAVAMMERVNDV